MPTWHSLEELLTVSPWIAFIVGVVWCWIVGLRDS